MQEVERRLPVSSGCGRRGAGSARKRKEGGEEENGAQLSHGAPVSKPEQRTRRFRHLQTSKRVS